MNWLAYFLGLTLSGYAAVQDGDSLTIDHEHVRLYGIDAPEWEQECDRADGSHWQCGLIAWSRLIAITRGHVVTCHPKDRDKYNRIVALCKVGDQDINRQMVREGLAVAYVRYSSDYVAAEAEAKAEKLGIWQGPFENPEDWRRHPHVRQRRVYP